MLACPSRGDSAKAAITNTQFCGGRLLAVSVICSNLKVVEVTVVGNVGIASPGEETGLAVDDVPESCKKSLIVN